MKLDLRSFTEGYGLQFSAWLAVNEKPRGSRGWKELAGVTQETGTSWDKSTSIGTSWDG